ncbi:hypothetical protein [Candidatus Enterococcus clewellii]|uniref:C2H2-type domain-containing protein n=1 Tax=Candidatus Enterococcus clewellii TaxID=1834193 RepID=A0A242K1G0_9ENTE|nr:hypothetical protein [Enterococcus sp. 9E7_DIV0242]OTP11499.1 hypothetical protein A5888_003598 [Enterococcus sp. 9E7_DIV0242]
MNEMSCPLCGKKFTYEEVRMIDRHVKKKMPIVCPYCDQVAKSKLSHGYFVTYKIL